MITLRAENAHHALFLGMCHAANLKSLGLAVDTRNGPAAVSVEPVTTRYEHPEQRVVFYHERDANPFFHLFEALWMLAGRQDVGLPGRYVQQMYAYSDDGINLHGAYGHRWRVHFGKDQLELIIRNLRRDPGCRRQMLGFWDPRKDLVTVAGHVPKDLPCNLAATFQRGVVNPGQLNMTVFCRSNDVLWGAYGANAVHLSMLQEYVARAVGMEVGWLEQVSVNWHAYLNEQLERVLPIAHHPYGGNPYERNSEVKALPLFTGGARDRQAFDEDVRDFCRAAAEGWGRPAALSTPFMRGVAEPMRRAHLAYTTTPKPGAFPAAREHLDRMHECDWFVAAHDWIDRRERRWLFQKDKRQEATS